MKRLIGYVESIDWKENTCRLRIPNIDGLEMMSYIDPAIAILRQRRTRNEDLQIADIPYHMQGLRIKDIVFCVDSEDESDKYTILGFYGGTSDGK